ncbi:hypothetical protein TorRG33x02_066150 [Trema orientale]|uniref:Uncharacterized protein n=1 Tax=Trema orientale TaxID=63057 RepID=A0A2P5FIS6_TREOI|nr:hypothetical protein TorRG33x02_066150 [Trema orientale]
MNEEKGRRDEDFFVRSFDRFHDLQPSESPWGLKFVDGVYFRRRLIELSLQNFVFFDSDEPEALRVRELSLKILEEESRVPARGSIPDCCAVRSLDRFSEARVF